MTTESGPVETSTPKESASSGCPVLHQSSGASASSANAHWWPEQLNLRPLAKNSPLLDPTDGDYDYKSEFESLDLDAVKADLTALMTDSQAWWPADYGHYGQIGRAHG